VMSLFGRGMEFIKPPKMKSKTEPIKQPYYNHNQGWMR
jgi:hypothetical protein